MERWLQGLLLTLMEASAKVAARPRTRAQVKVVRHCVQESLFAFWRCSASECGRGVAMVLLPTRAPEFENQKVLRETSRSRGSRVTQFQIRAEHMDTYISFSKGAKHYLLGLRRPSRRRSKT